MSLPLPIRAAGLIGCMAAAWAMNAYMQSSVDEAVASEQAANPAPPKCDPAYTGACVPVDVLDVDCANIGADGPFYVRGPVRVVGRDSYRLDPDHNGFACDPSHPEVAISAAKR